jgi:hypothetical protein
MPHPAKVSSVPAIWVLQWEYRNEKYRGSWLRVSLNSQGVRVAYCKPCASAKALN